MNKDVFCVWLTCPRRLSLLICPHKATTWVRLLHGWEWSNMAQTCPKLAFPNPYEQKIGFLPFGAEARFLGVGLPFLFKKCCWLNFGSERVFLWKMEMWLRSGASNWLWVGKELLLCCGVEFICSAHESHSFNGDHHPTTDWLKGGQIVSPLLVCVLDGSFTFIQDCCIYSSPRKEFRASSMGDGQMNEKYGENHRLIMPNKEA